MAIVESTVMDTFLGIQPQKPFIVIYAYEI
jgi:hypothetical protein